MKYISKNYLCNLNELYDYSFPVVTRVCVYQIKTINEQSKLTVSEIKTMIPTKKVNQPAELAYLGLNAWRNSPVLQKTNKIGAI